MVYGVFVVISTYTQLCYLAYFLIGILLNGMWCIGVQTMYSGNLNEQIHYAPQESERSVFTNHEWM